MRKLGLVCVVLSMVASGAAPSGAPQKPGSLTPVPLIVTVHATDSAGNPYLIRGDGYTTDANGNTTYTAGQDGVKANIDQYGNLIIDFQSTRAKIRGLVYDYSQPLDGQTTKPSGDGSNHYMSTIGGDLQPMVVGDSILVASCPHYDDALQYRHSFNRDCQSGFDSLGSALIVTRTTETTWVVESEAQATSRVFGITLKGRSQVQDFGHFSLPFRMTLTAK